MLGGVVGGFSSGMRRDRDDGKRRENHGINRRDNG